MVFDWGFRCFSDIEGSITNKSIYAFSFLVGKHRNPQSINAKLFLPIRPFGIVAYAVTLLWDNLCRNSCIAQGVRNLGVDHRINNSITCALEPCIGGLHIAASKFPLQPFLRFKLEPPRIPILASLETPRNGAPAFGIRISVIVRQTWSVIVRFDSFHS